MPTFFCTDVRKCVILVDFDFTFVKLPLKM